jgi:hypothetical protein
VVVIAIVIPIPIPIAVPVVPGDAPMPARAVIEVAAPSHAAHMTVAAATHVAAAAGHAAHMPAATTAATRNRSAAAADTHAAAAAKGADMTAAAAPATASAASTTLHELDHAARALEVKGGACLGRQLSRRHQSETARKSSYRHRIPHREFPFMDRWCRPRGRLRTAHFCSENAGLRPLFRQRESPMTGARGGGFAYQHFVAYFSLPFQIHDKVILDAANRWPPVALR